MITADELIEEYMERYETDRLNAAEMALEDVKGVVTELEEQIVAAVVKKGDT